MFDKYKDYMFYLLPAALKDCRQKINQLYIFFSCAGSLFDDIKRDLFRLRKETMIVSASEVMLATHGSDRDTSRLQGESTEAYRNRLAMKVIIAEKAGTKAGVMLTIAALGYTDFDIIPMRERYPERWAEFLAVIDMSVNETHPISLAVLRSEVRKVKEASALDNYLFRYKSDKVFNDEYISFRVAYRLFAYYFNGLRTDGTWQLDGTRRLNGGTQEYPVQQHYKIPALINAERAGKLTCNAKHNIHYTDGTWQTDGSIQLDAYNRTEVL